MMTFFFFFFLILLTVLVKSQLFAQVCSVSRTFASLDCPLISFSRILYLSNYMLPTRNGTCIDIFGSLFQSRLTVFSTQPSETTTCKSVSIQLGTVSAMTPETAGFLFSFHVSHHCIWSYAAMNYLQEHIFQVIGLESNAFGGLSWCKRHLQLGPSELDVKEWLLFLGAQYLQESLVLFLFFLQLGGSYCLYWHLSQPGFVMWSKPRVCVLHFDPHHLFG